METLFRVTEIYISVSFVSLYLQNKISDICCLVTISHKGIVDIYCSKTGHYISHSPTCLKTFSELLSMPTINSEGRIWLLNTYCALDMLLLCHSSRVICHSELRQSRLILNAQIQTCDNKFSASATVKVQHFQLEKKPSILYKTGVILKGWVQWYSKQ